MSPGSFKSVINEMCLQIIYLRFINQQDLVLNSIQWLICLKTQPNQRKNTSFNEALYQNISLLDNQFVIGFFNGVMFRFGHSQKKVSIELMFFIYCERKTEL